jgi:hypothetical protein
MDWDPVLFAGLLFFQAKSFLFFCDQIFAFMVYPDFNGAVPINSCDKRPLVGKDYVCNSFQSFLKNFYLLVICYISACKKNDATPLWISTSLSTAFFLICLSPDITTQFCMPHFSSHSISNVVSEKWSSCFSTLMPSSFSRLAISFPEDRSMKKVTSSSSFEGETFVFDCFSDLFFFDPIIPS